MRRAILKVEVEGNKIILSDAESEQTIAVETTKEAVEHFQNWLLAGTFKQRG